MNSAFKLRIALAKTAFQRFSLFRLHSRSYQFSNMAEQTYFNRFQNFRPNSQATLNENFKQLAISKGWQQNSTRYRKERKDYMNALVDDYIESIDRGGAPDKLAGLQGLCGDLNVSPIPTSNTQCKRVCHGCSDSVLSFPSLTGLASNWG